MSLDVLAAPETTSEPEKVYAQYLARRETRYQMIARLQARLDAYADAVEDELLNDLREMAKEPLNPSLTAGAAREILNELSFFPELTNPAQQATVFVDPPLFPKEEESVKPQGETMPVPPPHEPPKSIFPNLARVGRDKSMLVIGGERPDADRIAWAQKHSVEIDWVPVTPHRSLGMIDTVVKMLDDKEYMGAIVLDGAVDQSVVTRVRESCSKSKTPVSYAHKGAPGSMWQAFEGVERTYAKANLSRVA